MRVLVACEYSGIVRDAFTRRGHDAWSCDLLPTERDGNHIQDDVLKHLDLCALVCYYNYMVTKQIKGFDAYRIREDGILETNWRTGAFYPNMPCDDKWKPLPQRFNEDGYIPVCLRGSVGTRQRRTHIHRLVAECFLGPPPSPKACVRHLDGNPRNNTISNLAWGTYLDNENDKHKHGTYSKRISNGKLTETTMALARELSLRGVSERLIAAQIGVTRPTVNRFLNGRTWV